MAEDIPAASHYCREEAVVICDENLDVEMEICISDTRKLKNNILNYKGGDGDT